MKNNVNPLVSVCIPVYNRRDMLRRCLVSVSLQTVKDIEIVVLDNCSEDDLGRVVEEIGDPRIRYVRNSNNIGAARNFIKASSLARGKYLKFLCSDDVLLPSCLEDCVAELESYPQASALFFRTVYYEDEDSSNFQSYPLPRIGLVNSLEYSDNQDIFGFLNVGPTVMFIKSSDFWDLGGFDNTLCAAIDWELYYRLLKSEPGIVFFDKVLSISFFHNTNESNVQSANLGFLKDVLMLRRRGAPGARISYANNIWRNLSQSIRSGKSIVPVLKLVYQYGYLSSFVVALPELLLIHALSRFKMYLPKKYIKSSSCEFSIVESDTFHNYLIQILISSKISEVNL